MKRYILAVLAVMSVATTATYCFSDEETAADFFRKDKEIWSKGKSIGIDFTAHLFSSNSDAPKEVAKMVADSARDALGPEWVGSALQIARLESSFSCNATGPKINGGRASGVFQVMPKSAEALGYDYNRLHECKYGIDAGIQHMKTCIELGHVKTSSQMKACHVAGWKGWNKRLRRRAQIYRKKYVRLANRKLPRWAKNL
jgi:hypothetical protein